MGSNALLWMAVYVLFLRAFIFLDGNTPSKWEVERLASDTRECERKVQDLDHELFRIRLKVDELTRRR